jgi:hypothetical protein
MVSYRNGVVRCGAEAMADYEDPQPNEEPDEDPQSNEKPKPHDVAYWFKVMVYSAMSDPRLSAKKSDSCPKAAFASLRNVHISKI